MACRRRFPRRRRLAFWSVRSGITARIPLRRRDWRIARDEYALSAMTARRRFAQLHVGQAVGRDEDLAAVLVHEAQQLRLAGQCLGHHPLDLLGTLTALQNDLAGRVLHADLDLHGYVPPNGQCCAGVRAVPSTH
ncbi:hypothetical protein SGLAM104S_10523 [Streptomyces glaucescens]